jgi:uncharacterized protein (DUF2164 family)
MGAAGSMRIKLSDERSERLVSALQKFNKVSFEEDLSDYRARRLLEFFVKQLGPPIYNQGIQDARGFLFQKLDDLDAEFYEPDDDAAD